MDTILIPNELKLDAEEIVDYGVTIEDFLHQIEFFKTGLPFTMVENACTIGNGIYKIEDNEKDELLELQNSSAENGKYSKFVPASGAATRMFRKLLAILDENNFKSFQDLLDSEEDLAKTAIEFLNGIENLAIFTELKDKLIYKNDKFELLYLLLDENQLDYSKIPKGLLPFHKYDGFTRTAVEEHIYEAQYYIKDLDDVVKLHFTISPDFNERFEDLIKEVKSRKEFENLTLDITYSNQEHATDTIAVDLNNIPVRDNHGKLHFRPSGHGALLNNLNKINSDFVFIKNIDNVVPDKLKLEIVYYHQLLGGMIIKLQSEVFNYLEKLESGYNKALNIEIIDYIRERFFLDVSENLIGKNDNEVSEFLFNHMNRPIRVCGMVKNTGQPGGGPFWVRNKENILYPQIVESFQIDLNNPEQKEIFEKSTHFNPVDLVCSTKDYKGRKFDLINYRNLTQGFITHKYLGSKKIKALELPGLWNGSMAEWLTLFIEVPIITFNPVKEINDLLLPVHRTI